MNAKTTITLPREFDFYKCLKFLQRNEEECLFKTDHDTIYTSLKIHEEVVPFSIKALDQELELNWSINENSEDLKDALVIHVKEWLDLERDLNAFYPKLDETPNLKPLLRFKGLRLIGIPSLFEALCWSVIGQQINLNFAYKLKNRLVKAYGTQCEYQGKVFWHFPTPERLLELDDTFRESNQYSRGKINYLRNIAEAFAEGYVSKEKLKSLSSFEERQRLLTQIKGIGEWSANYALMKCLHEPQAIPFGDTGLTQALFNLGLITDRKDRYQIEEFFKSVEEWESYTTFYLWYSLM